MYTCNFNIHSLKYQRNIETERPASAEVDRFLFWCRGLKCHSLCISKAALKSDCFICSSVDKLGSLSVGKYLYNKSNLNIFAFVCH